ncbi:uncharacterized protein LOC126655355 isoform X2 [Mercurialis annua]|uniref:uncharacterized protein LOC126655355 isoform X2 n=1 Tax=Mercurialis annua TaxID=3986 RepID=UPI00215E4A2D|nr:uncharacterized protein LOC126655355 isoform X2 [Mercurialis annua]
MPLLKKKPFLLFQTPKDLKPNELVYQVRFTKEIFRDYQMYLNRLNLYRQRIWSCKISGKAHLTFEEALVSEKNATEMVQQMPKEVVAPALRIIQYSMLTLKDLADTIATKLQENLFVGAILHGKKGDSLCPCKILKILDNGTVKIQYEVAWLAMNNKIVETSVVNREDLLWKKIPFSRRMLKPFIRESTYRNGPWALHINLAKKHGISCDLPPELKGKFSIKDGLLICCKKRKDLEDQKNAGDVEKESKKHKKKKVGDDQPSDDPIKYPIDDLLVQPGADDPVFTIRPSPSRDFHIQMDCVGDLLMVWDFCTSFSKMLHLWPFSLEDFENAIFHKDSNLILLVETHSSLFHLLIKDHGEYFLAVQKRNRKLKITLTNWTDYLCDFLEMINNPDLSVHATTVKRGHYGLLDVQAKLGILRELVNHVLDTDLIREKLDEHIEQLQLLGATKREKIIEEGRRRREGKEKFKVENNVKVMIGISMERVENNPMVLENEKHTRENGDNAKIGKWEVVSSSENHKSDKKEQKENFKAETVDTCSIERVGNNQNGLENQKHPRENGNAAKRRKGDESHASDESETSHLDIASKKSKQNGDVEVLGEDIKNSSSKTGLEQLKKEWKHAVEKRSKEERAKFYEKEMEKRVLRTCYLGKDRDYNRYWWFRRDGRIFVESSDSKLWGYYSNKEELDALMGSLNCKGEREKDFKNQLQKFHDRICIVLQKRWKDLANKIELEEAVLRRSTRVRALPRENHRNYVNKWKED